MGRIPASCSAPRLSLILKNWDDDGRSEEKAAGQAGSRCLSDRGGGKQNPSGPELQGEV